MDRALLLAAAVCLALFAPGLELGAWHARFATYLHGLLFEAFPWLVLGAILAAAAEELLPDDLLPRLARRLGRAAVPGTALAAPLIPMCECGIIAVVRGLIAKGMPAHLAITFLLAAPILNPIVLATTWMAFADWRMVALRAACGLVIACAAGAIAARALPAAILAHPPAPTRPPHMRIALRGAQPASVETVALSGGAVFSAASARPDRIGGIARRALGHTLDIAAVFIIGAMLAAAAKILIPPEWIGAWGSGLLSGPAMGAGLAVGMSVCAETDAFIAASLTGLMAPHALLCFLVVGPMLDLKLLLLYRGVFTRRTVLWLACGIPSSAILCTMLASRAW